MSKTTHGSPFEAPEVEEVARLFPSYEVLGLIACGGMGAVYHAIQTSLDRPVAIKILPREFSTDAKFRASFESEAKAMAKLNHPNLIGVYDFGEVGGLLFIVMEFVAGQSLHQAAHGCAVEHADAVNLVIGVCHGLAHAHDFGILHRDIKPSNILLDGQMNPKIGDFGLARALERQIEEGEQIFGTPGYTAPEVLQSPFTVDQRADIFSVGVMLHELLTGHLPEADPRPASQICGCNPRLDALIQRATDPDPNRRFRSAMEVAKELVKIASTPTRTLRTGAPPSKLKVGAPAVSKTVPNAVPKTVPNAVPKPAADAVPKVPNVVPKPGHTALSRPVHKALSRPTPALSRPAAAASPRPQSPFNQPKTLAKESSGSGLVIFLVIALIAAVVAYFVVKGRQDETAAPVSPPPTPAVAEKPAPPPAAAPEEEEAKELDPADVLARARSSMRQRLGPSVESHRRDMKDNLENYRKAMEAAAEGLSFGERERIRETLAENLKLWESGGDRLPEAPSTGFGAVEGAADIHATHLEKQAAIQRDLESEIASLAGVYVLELQNQIEQISKDGNARAVSALEEEVRSVQGNVQRFREKMGE
jgi:serine/threonine protein kinase